MLVKHITMTDFMKEKLYEIFIKSDLKATRFFIAVDSFIFGLFLILHQNGLNTDPIYVLFLKILPEDVWGILFVMQSIVAILSLLLSIKNLYTLLLDGVLGCVLWTASTTSYMLGYFHALPSHSFPIMLIGNIMIAIMVWWCMIRCWATRQINHTISVIELQDERQLKTLHRRVSDV